MNMQRNLWKAALHAQRTGGPPARASRVQAARVDFSIGSCRPMVPAGPPFELFPLRR